MPPIIGAARSGDTVQIERLLAGGADPNVRAGAKKWTPLMHAIHKNQAGSVRVLLARGADPNARADGGITALIMAAGYGRADIVRALLEKGADPKQRADNDVDALTVAIGGVPDIDRFTVGRCQTDTVRALLAADPSVRTSPGRWARLSAGVARLAGCREVLDLLAGRRRPDEVHR
jgi:hypothetical protein